jgi:hypothetical protein
LTGKQNDDNLSLNLFIERSDQIDHLLKLRNPLREIGRLEGSTAKPADA